MKLGMLAAPGVGLRYAAPPMTGTESAATNPFLIVKLCAAGQRMCE